MFQNNNPLYKAHVRNLRSVTDGIAQIQRQLNNAIAIEDQQTTRTLVNIYLLLAGAWAECRLKKVLYEINGFTDDDRAVVQQQRTQAEKWKKALEIGYRKRYQVSRSPLSLNSLPGTAWFRYQALTTIITDDLEPLIGLRNTFAHGQWERPLNSDETAINPQIIAAIQRENALSVKFKLSIITSLADLIHDLVAATSFERDFDQNYGLITTARRNLSNRSYATWKSKMVEKRRRGRQKRDDAIRGGSTGGSP